jgi:hypothetical protein
VAKRALPPSQPRKSRRGVDMHLLRVWIQG